MCTSRTNIVAYYLRPSLHDTRPPLHLMLGKQSIRHAPLQNEILFKQAQVCTHPHKSTQASTGMRTSICTSRSKLADQLDARYTNMSHTVCAVTLAEDRNSRHVVQV